MIKLGDLLMRHNWITPSIMTSAAISMWFNPMRFLFWWWACMAVASWILFWKENKLKKQ